VSLRGDPVAEQAVSTSAIAVIPRRNIRAENPGRPISLVPSPARYGLAELEGGPPDPPAVSAPLGLRLSGPGGSRSSRCPGRLARTAKKRRDHKQSQDPHGGPPFPVGRALWPGDADSTRIRQSQRQARDGCSIPAKAIAPNAPDPPPSGAGAWAGPVQSRRDRARGPAGDLLGLLPGSPSPATVAGPADHCRSLPRPLRLLGRYVSAGDRHAG